MMGELLEDPDQLEGGPSQAIGLKLLPLSTRFTPSKVLRQLDVEMIWPIRTRVQGYELHQGMTHPSNNSWNPISADNAGLCWRSKEGNCAGTYLHGIFDNGCWRRSWINHLRDARSLPSLPINQPNHAAQREKLLERLADSFDKHVEWQKLLD